MSSLPNGISFPTIYLKPNFSIIQTNRQTKRNKLQLTSSTSRGFAFINSSIVPIPFPINLCASISEISSWPKFGRSHHIRALNDFSKITDDKTALKDFSVNWLAWKNSTKLLTSRSAVRTIFCTSIARDVFSIVTRLNAACKRLEKFNIKTIVINFIDYCESQFWHKSHRILFRHLTNTLCVERFQFCRGLKIEFA